MKHSAQPSTAGDCAGNDVSESITEIAMVHTHISSSDSSVTSPTLECNRGTGAPIGNCVETAIQVRFEETGETPWQRRRTVERECSCSRGCALSLERPWPPSGWSGRIV